MPKTKRTLTRFQKIERHVSKAIKTGKLSQREIEKLLGKEKEAQKEDLLDATMKEATR